MVEVTADGGPCSHWGTPLGLGDSCGLPELLKKDVLRLREGLGSEKKLNLIMSSLIWFRAYIFRTIPKSLLLETTVGMKSHIFVQQYGHNRSSQYVRSLYGGGR